MSLMKTVKAGCILLVVALVLGILLQALGQLKGQSNYSEESQVLSRLNGKPEYHENQLSLNSEGFTSIQGSLDFSLNKELPSGIEVKSFRAESNEVRLKVSCISKDVCDALPETFQEIGFSNVKIAGKGVSRIVKEHDSYSIFEFDLMVARDDFMNRTGIIIPPSQEASQNASSPNAVASEQEVACGDTQRELNECANNGEKIADKELNDLYWQQYNYLQTDDKKAQFKKAQLAWIKYRDAVCDYEVTSNGGSMYPMALSGCLQAVTMKRVLDLRGYLNCRENGCPD